MVVSFNRRVRLLVLSLAAGALLGGWVDAAPPVANPLASHGLEPKGSLYLLTAETEIHTKVSEVKTLRNQFMNAEARQRSYGSAQDYQQIVKGFGNQISQLRTEMQNVSQQMNQLPRGRRGFANSIVTEQYNEYQMYRNQLQVQINETTATLNQIKSQPFDPKAKTRLDADVLERRQAYDQALVDLRATIDKAHQSYLELAADDSVKKTLYTLGRSAKIAPKLGPSHEFSAAVKLLEKLERESTPGESREPQPKPKRGARTSFRDLRPNEPMV